MLCGMDRKRIMYFINDIGMTWIVFVYTCICIHVVEL